jgi:hypothetical protein
MRFPVHLFLKRMYSAWASGITGSLSAPLFLWAVFTNGAPKYVLFGFAVVCLHVAAGIVWWQECRRAEGLRAELDNERSAKFAPDLGLELSQEGELMIHNRSQDKNAHNISLRSSYALDAESIPFLMRGVKMPFPITHSVRPGEGTLWDRQPYPLEPFPENSIETTMQLLLDFTDRQGTTVYVAEFSLVFDKLRGVSVRQVGVTVKAKVPFQ